MAPALTAPNQPLGKTIWRFAWVNALVSILAYMFEMISGIPLPTGTAFIGHLLAIAASMHQFVTHFDTTMSLWDRIVFSVVATLIGILTILIEILLALKADGFPLSIDGTGEWLGIDDLRLGMLIGGAVPIALLIFAATFAAVCFFVWLFRRSQEQGI